MIDPSGQKHLCGFTTYGAFSIRNGITPSNTGPLRHWIVRWTRCLQIEPLEKGEEESTRHWIKVKTARPCLQQPRRLLLLLPPPYLLESFFSRRGEMPGPSDLANDSVDMLATAWVTPQEPPCQKHPCHHHAILRHLRSRFRMRDQKD